MQNDIDWMDLRQSWSLMALIVPPCRRCMLAFAKAQLLQNHTRACAPATWWQGHFPYLVYLPVALLLMQQACAAVCTVPPRTVLIKDLGDRNAPQKAEHGDVKMSKRPLHVLQYYKWIVCARCQILSGVSSSCAWVMVSVEAFPTCCTHRVM